MELDGTASHKAHPAPCLLAGASVVEARRLGEGGRGSPDRWRRPQRAGQPLRAGSAVECSHGEHEHGEHGHAQPGSAVEAGRSKRGRGGELHFFNGVQTRGSEDATASGGDAFVRTDARDRGSISASLCILMALL
jgi:hypothetical protein